MLGPLTHAGLCELMTHAGSVHVAELIDRDALAQFCDEHRVCLAIIDLRETDSVSELVRQIASTGLIPAYTGANFDALDDSLMDAPDDVAGHILVGLGGVEFLQKQPTLAVGLMRSWFSGARFWGQSGRPFHLILVD